MAIDPVCKMEVDESQEAATSEYKGQKYYFCAVGCKKAFDENPEKYLAEDKEVGLVLEDAKLKGVLH